MFLTFLCEDEGDAPFSGCIDLIVETTACNTHASTCLPTSGTSKDTKQSWMHRCYQRAVGDWIPVVPFALSSWALCLSANSAQATGSLSELIAFQQTTRQFPSRSLEEGWQGSGVAPSTKCFPLEREVVPGMRKRLPWGAVYASFLYGTHWWKSEKVIGLTGETLRNDEIPENQGRATREDQNKVSGR